MNRIACRLLLVASLILVTSAAHAVGKVTVDPNKVPRVERPASPPLWETDKRLDVKIEYDAGNARLHKVIEDLVEMSKVRIYSGAIPNDWRARDIPVTVALRDAAIALIRASETEYIQSTRAVPTWSFSAREPAATRPVTAAELEDGRVRISLQDGFLTLEAGVQSDYEDGKTCRTASTNAADMADYVWMVAKDRGGLPQQPGVPEVPNLRSVCPDLEELSDSLQEAAELSQKVTIQPNADGKPVLPADVIIAVSKATGLSVVCADFTSHLGQGQPTGSQAESRSLISNAITCSWKWDADAKAMVGYDYLWFENHKKLLPERIINDLIAKANGDGVDLDDLAGLSDYPREAAIEWLSNGILSGLPFWYFVEQPTQPLWAFYNSLSPADKARAKSGNGLSLARLDKSPILRYVKNKIGQEDTGLFSPLDVAAESSPPGAPDWRRLLNTNVIPSLVLRIEKRLPATNPVFNRVGQVVILRFLGMYAMVIEGTDGTATYSLAITGGPLLPYFSPERQKVLEAAVRRQDEAAKPDK